MDYLVTFENGIEHHFYATTDRRAESIAQIHAAELGATTFRLYRLGVCPTCHHNTETYLSLWKLQDDGWTIVPD